MTEPADVKAVPNDLELRGVPAGLPPPAELEAANPDAIFVGAYSRISDDWRQHSKKKAAASSWKAGKGVANQHRRNDTNAARHGLIIVYRYTDNDLSASKADVERPDFLAMLRDLRRGRTPEGYRIDGTICVDQDRLQRTGRDWEDYVDALTVDPRRLLWTPSGSMDLNEEGDIIKAGVMAVVNKAESLKKKRRARDWHQDRILDGLPHSGPRPFGWEDDRLTLRRAESDFLGWAIRERIKGKSTGSLCEEARRRGLTGTKGSRIIPQTMSQMMTAPRVCGYRANRGELVLDEHGEPIVGVWERIVEPEEWRAVCATMSDGSTYLARGSGTARITGVPKTIKYLASGLLRCVRRIEPEDVGDGPPQICNGPMNGSRAKSKASPYVYVCRRCAANAISGPMVDRQIVKLLMAKLKKADATFVLREESWPSHAELKDKADKLAGLESRWSLGVVSDEMFYRLAPGLEAEVKKLRREKAQWESERTADDERPSDIMRKWQDGEYDLTQQRKVLFEAFAAIQVTPGQKGTKVADPHRLKPVWK